MMGKVVPETCWAYEKYNEIISGTKCRYIYYLMCDFKHQYFMNFISLYCFLSVQYLNYISVFQLIALN